MGTIQTIGSTLAKKLPQIEQAISTKTQQLPEFLYHFTSAESADKIIRSGKLLAQKDGGAFDRAGVFMVDLENFVKNWTKSFWGDGEHCSYNLFNGLFGQATKFGEKLACFRIPRSKLCNDIVIRDQADLGKAMEKRDLGEDVSDLIKKVDDASLYKKYHEKGQAIEFINLGDIEVNEANLVGIVDLPCELQGIMAQGKEPFKSGFDTLKYLFINQPEAKMLESI